MNELSFNWPQIVWIIIVVLILVQATIKHGEYKGGNYDGGAILVAAAFVSALYWIGGFYDTIGLAQVTMIVWITISVGVNVFKDGEPIESRYNLVKTAIVTGAETFVLYAGGFFT